VLGSQGDTSLFKPGVVLGLGAGLTAAGTGTDFGAGVAAYKTDWNNFSPSIGAPSLRASRVRNSNNFRSS
jgi:hypothetical protein